MEDAAGIILFPQNRFATLSARDEPLIAVCSTAHIRANYFGMLNPIPRIERWNVGDDGNTYQVDGIDDKLNLSNKTDEGVAIPLFKFKSSCIDDASSAWVRSFGDVSRYNFLTSRPCIARLQSRARRQTWAPRSGGKQRPGLNV